MSKCGILTSNRIHSAPEHLSFIQTLHVITWQWKLHVCSRASTVWQLILFFLNLNYSCRGDSVQSGFCPFIAGIDTLVMSMKQTINMFTLRSDVLLKGKLLRPESITCSQYGPFKVKSSLFLTSRLHLPEIEEWKSRIEVLVFTLQRFNSNYVRG